MTPFERSHPRFFQAISISGYKPYLVGVNVEEVNKKANFAKNSIHSIYSLPAQMTCNVPRQVGATSKALWAYVKQNNAALKLRLTKKQYKGLDKPPKFIWITCTLNYNRDYSFESALRVSIITLAGSIVVPYKLLFHSENCGFDLHAERSGSKETRAKRASRRAGLFENGVYFSRQTMCRRLSRKLDRNREVRAFLMWTIDTIPAFTRSRAG